MRIIRVRANNVLSFDNLELNLMEPGPTILVGPNGAGKTNIFRLIRHLIDGVHYYNSNDMRGNWNEVLASWKRREKEDCIIEIEIDWTHPQERELIGGYYQMVLASPVEIARGLEPSPPANEWPGWASFVATLKDQLPADILGQQWCGTLGCRQSVPDSTVLYFRPKVSSGSWEYVLTSPYGITGSPFSNLDGYSSRSLPRIWIASLPEDTRSKLNTALREAQDDLFSLKMSWSDVWDSINLALNSTPERVVVDAKISSNDQFKLRQYWQHVLDQLGVKLDGRVYPTFLLVLSRLLRSCVISEDLLNPPNQDYSPTALKEYGVSTRSQHLSAHLFTLKNGTDSERNRFAQISDMFHTLSGRKLDVSLELISSGSQGTEKYVVMPTSSRQENQVTAWTSEDETNSVTMRIRLMQRGTKDTRSIPLTESGAGLVEIAYVSSVLNSPDSHVILLDEPGRSLHPHALMQLRYLLQGRISTQSTAQLVVITHSPYLITPSMPHMVRRLSWIVETGRTEITSIDTKTNFDTEKAKQEAIQRELARQDRWGRSPNWPSLLFSTVVLLVDGETEIGALPEWYETQYGEPMEAIGVSILSIGGKPNGGKNILDLDSLHIPWVMLIDGDSLKTGSGNIWSELKIANRTGNEQANRKRAMSIEVQNALLQNLNIYVMGQCEEDNFESVMEAENPDKKPPKLNDSKVLRGRWWAQNAKCPKVVQEVFQAVIRYADQSRVHQQSSEAVREPSK